MVEAEGADLLLLHHESELHALSGDQVALVRNPSVDPTRHLYRIGWRPSAATRVADADMAVLLWEQAPNRGALAVAAQCSGLVMRMLDLAIDHSAQRRQFGRTVGSFQAVKHRLADVAVQIESASR